jgi:cyclase
MLQNRIIPVLLLQKKGLVKTVQFGKGKYIGDPINAIKIFNDKECDELVFLDIDASKENRPPDFDYIKSIATECFMPFGYGGGIRSMDDINRLFSLGVEKVILNTIGLQHMDLIASAAATYGNQSIVLSVDVKKNLFGQYSIFSHAQVKHKHNDLIAYIQAGIKAGAGEIMLNMVDRDGIMKGYDLKLIQFVSKAIQVPLVVCGGAGNLNDLRQAIDHGASGVAAGSLFVYHGPHKAVLINYPAYAECKKLFN